MTTRRTLDKSNAAGRAGQTRIESILEQYAKQGRAKIRKIDPPLKVMGTGPRRKVIFLENPWLDYGGVWTERHNRAIQIEVKHTEDERLPLGTSGVSHNQIRAIRDWTEAGTITAVAWVRATEIRIIPGHELLMAWDAGAKSLRWRHIPPCPRGEGFVEFDILSDLAERT